MKIIAELTILKARCQNLQFTCAILIVSSRQNCRGHIMHHDTFHKMLAPPPLGTRINNTVPALKTTAVNRPVPALKKKRPSRREQKIQPPRPVPPRKKKNNRPVPPWEKKTTAPSRLGKKKQPPRPASGKKTTAPSLLGKKKNRPVPPPKKKNNRPVPPRILPRKIPSRPVPPRISTPIFCQSRAPAEMKKVGQPSIFPPSRPVEILAVHVKPWKYRGETHRYTVHIHLPPCRDTARAIRSFI